MYIDLGKVIEIIICTFGGGRYVCRAFCTRANIFVCMSACDNVEMSGYVAVPEVAFVAFVASRLVASRFAARVHVFEHMTNANIRSWRVSVIIGRNCV